MTTHVRLENVALVLHRPHFSGNIGSAARAACNMGLSRLIVVSPENYDREKALPMATHVARKLVDDIEFQEDLAAALAPFSYVVGTTARRGGERQVVLSPAEMARDLASISQENSVAVLFGPEDRGLTNEELRLCHQLVTIPTAEFSSLNLAQAVMVICYELFKTTLAEPRPSVPRLASRIELDGMYEQVKDLLVRINYILPDNPDYWMNKLRRFFSRLELRAGEVSIVRGICRQVDWYAEHRYREGRKASRE